MKAAIWQPKLIVQLPETTILWPGKTLKALHFVTFMQQIKAKYLDKQWVRGKLSFKKKQANKLTIKEYINFRHMLNFQYFCHSIEHWISIVSWKLLDNNEAPTYFCSNVKITRIGRLFKPPGHELKHINWNMLVTKSLPAAKCKSREDGMGINNI